LRWKDAHSFGGEEDRLGDAIGRAAADDIAGDVILGLVGKLVGVVADLIADRDEQARDPLPVCRRPGDRPRHERQYARVPSIDERGRRQMLRIWWVVAPVFWLSHHQKVAAGVIVRRVKSLSAEDLAAIDVAGRRCAVCRTGRRWREFALIRPDGGEPLVMCPACRARYGDTPPGPVGREQIVDAPPARAAEPPATTPERRARESEDRVRRVLRELPKGEYTTGRIAKAAGLNGAKTLRRLRELAASGEIREVGKRWSTEAPPSDIDEALDRLQARTTNIRIVRDRSLVG
jgi:hypothetical protein